jgi:hypothetical protein
MAMIDGMSSTNRTATAAVLGRRGGAGGRLLAGRVVYCQPFYRDDPTESLLSGEQNAIKYLPRIILKLAFDVAGELALFLTIGMLVAIAAIAQGVDKATDQDIRELRSRMEKLSAPFTVDELFAACDRAKPRSAPLSVTQGFGTSFESELVSGDNRVTFMVRPREGAAGSVMIIAVAQDYLQLYHLPYDVTPMDVLDGFKKNGPGKTVAVLKGFRKTDPKTDIPFTTIALPLVDGGDPGLVASWEDGVWQKRGLIAPR